MNRRFMSMFLLRIVSIIAAVGFVVTAVRAEGDAPDPELERKSFTVAEGFEVNLWAADPQLAKPIQMNWDERGRLWVATSRMYPQIKPGETPEDQIVILEDTDGDGRADQSTVFADKLLIPTGIEPGDGGAYVANSHELLHLKDSDGDDVADERRVMLSGFGTEDTHHLIHTFQWGMDGRLYFNQAVYINSHIETPGGVHRLFGSGVWRFDPQRIDLEIFTRGMINSWGHAFDEWGESFAVDGAGSGGIYHMFPGASFASLTANERDLGGLNSGSPKYCGVAIVSGRHMPDDWQGDAITNDFRANRVVRYKISDEHGTFVSRQMPDVIVSTDVAFRPVDVTMGPDGAIYIADWYNPIINHGEVDFRDPRRDKTHGRIWRITAKGRPLVEQPRLHGESIDSLLEQLKSPEGWTRQQSNRVLRERGSTTVLPALARWTAALDATDPLIDRHRLQSLWLHQAFHVPAPLLLKDLLRSKTPQARIAATRVLGDWVDQLPDAIKLLEPQVADEHARVRLEAVRALARVATPPAVELALRVLDRPMDKSIDHALWHLVRQTEPAWMPEVQSGALTFNDNDQHLFYALKSVKSPVAAEILARQMVKPDASKDDRIQALDVIAIAGGAEEILAALMLASDETIDSTVRVHALGAAEKAARERDILPVDVEDTVSHLVATSDSAVRSAALKLAGVWKFPEVRGTLINAAQNGADLPSQRAAIAALGEWGAENTDVLRDLAGEAYSREVRITALIALSNLDIEVAAELAASFLASAPNDFDPAELLNGFLQRNGAGDALATALGAEQVHPQLSRAILKHMASTGRNEKLLVERLQHGAGLQATGPKTLSPEEMAKMVSDVQRYGDAARGEALFRRDDLSCLKCHGIGGAGGQLGPDLGSIGASSPVDYLVESLLDPNKAIKDGYDSIIVTTKDRDAHSGIKIGEDEKQLYLRDALRDKFPIALDNIASTRSGGSLMPTGLTDALPSWEFINLVRFMSELGKPGPFQTNDATVVRRWRVVSSKVVDQLVKDESMLASEAADKLTWFPAYSLVSGDLPLSAMADDKEPIAFIRAEIDVTSAGEIAVHLGNTAGLQLWVDRERVELQPTVRTSLPVGTHTLTFRVDVAARGEGLRVELQDVEGSPGHAQPLVGR